MSRPLAWDDVVPVLEAIADVENTILVGGQALDFWCEKYLDDAPELKPLAPFTSKDVDFCAKRAAVKPIAERLKGKALLPKKDDFDAVNAGAVKYVDREGTERTLNILLNVLGLKVKEVRDTAIPAELPSGRYVRVLHPVLCLFSRFVNLVSLRRLGDPRSVAQARASVFCAREYIRQRASAGEIDDALRMGERLFVFARSEPAADKVYGAHRIEAFDAVQPWPELPEKFREIRYPQMRKKIATRRAKHHRGDAKR